MFTNMQVQMLADLKISISSVILDMQNTCIAMSFYLRNTISFVGSWILIFNIC